MSDRSRPRTLPPPPHLIAAGLVIAGVLLSLFVGQEFLLVAGLGAFGPGLLRELGWLRDQDELQRQAAQRAGYHAYLVGGLVTVTVASVLHRTGATPRHPAELMTFVLLVAWMTWLFSSLLGYWGARRTATTVLVVFGSFWAVFALASAIGEARSAGELATGLAMAAVFVGPFAVLAITARRWPRATGVALLASALGLLALVGPGQRNFALSTALMTLTLLLVPLVASGIALLREDPEEA